MKTRAFKSGNSQAVRIPAEIAYADSERDLEITRVGDVITIRPADAARTMRETIELLRSLPVPSILEEVDRGPGRDTLDDLADEAAVDRAVLD